MEGNGGMRDRQQIEVQVHGHTFGGWYTLKDGVVTVGSAWGSSSTQAGANAQPTAKILLREIVREAIARGDILL